MPLYSFLLITSAFFLVENYDFFGCFVDKLLKSPSSYKFISILKLASYVLSSYTSNY